MPYNKTANIFEVSFYLKNYVKCIVHNTDLGVLMGKYFIPLLIWEKPHKNKTIQAETSVCLSLTQNM